MGGGHGLVKGELAVFVQVLDRHGGMGQGQHARVADGHIDPGVGRGLHGGLDGLGDLQRGRRFDDPGLLLGGFGLLFLRGSGLLLCLLGRGGLFFLRLGGSGFFFRFFGRGGFLLAGGFRLRFGLFGWRYRVVGFGGKRLLRHGLGALRLRRQDARREHADEHHQHQKQ